jgi:hypothetical protein
MRLKKEYNQMVKKEITKVKKDNDFYNEPAKSPDRSGANSVGGYYAQSHQTSITQKSPYIHNSNNGVLGQTDYNASNKKR